jgi:glutathione synthase/RimK-type ligase-like ATP-grasp enzyme
MVLIISNERDSVTDLVVDSLKRTGVVFFRLNTDSLLTNSEFGFSISPNILTHFSQYGKLLDLSKITSVWYRRPIMPKTKIKSVIEKRFAEREILATIDTLWRVLDKCFWINSPWSIKDASNKFHQLQVACELGLQVPETLITNNYMAVEDFFRTCEGSMLYKPITSGHLSSQSSRIQLMTYSTLIKRGDLAKMKLVKNCPGMFQRYIEKQYEVRVTIVGNRVFSAKIDSQRYLEKRIDWRKGKYIKGIFTKCEIPVDLEEKLKMFLKRFDLKFGAFDLIVNKSGKYIFLECNPNGEWAWIEDCTGMPITDTLINLLVEGK